MALVYPNATLNPSKRELMNDWLPTRAWFDGQGRKPVGSFRFDDPAGEVGLEGFLLGAEGLPTLFLPLTYRGAELSEAEEHLIGTTEHSELGPRWVYDGCGDPVFLRSLAQAILTGATGVDHEFEGENGPETRPTNAQVRGSGSAGTEVPSIEVVGCHDEGPLTIVNAGPLEIVVARVAGSDIEAAQTLAVTWKGGTDVAIAGVRPG
jgi:Maltokinase N-terminal cap domain